MDQHQPDGQSSQYEAGKASSRRKFLRQVGMTAAATAALAGAADAFGLTPASAAAKQGTRGGSASPVKLSKAPPALLKRVREIRERKGMGPDQTYSICCGPAPGNCGKPCHPNGVWCHFCLYFDSSWYSCIEGDYSFCYPY